MKEYVMGLITGLAVVFIVSCFYLYRCYRIQEAVNFVNIKYIAKMAEDSETVNRTVKVLLDAEDEANSRKYYQARR